MRNLILATTVVLSSAASFAQVQLPADVEARLGKSQMSGNVRIEAMDIRALRESLSNVRTKAVFHLDANNQIELTPSSSTKERSATRPGEFVGSGGGTMDGRDVIDLTEPEGLPSLKLVGLEEIWGKAPRCAHDKKEMQTSGVDCIHFAIDSGFHQDSRDPMAYRMKSSTQVFDIKELSDRYFFSKETDAVIVGIIFLRFDRTLPKTEEGYFRVKDNFSVYHKFITLKKGVLNIVPVRKISIRKSGPLAVAELLEPVSIVSINGSAGGKTQVLPASYQWINTNLQPSSPNQESTETYYVSPGNYRFTVDDPRIEFTVERTIR